MAGLTYLRPSGHEHALLHRGRNLAEGYNNNGDYVRAPDTTGPQRLSTKYPVVRHRTRGTLQQ
jgi:hypothetical protein